MDKLDKKIKALFLKDVIVPNICKNAIKNALYEKPKKRFVKRFVLIKAMSGVCACMLLATSVVFAKDISNYVKNFFNNSQGIDTAISNAYIAQPNIKYVESNGIEVKVDNMLMDDFNLSLTFQVKLGENINKNKINRIRFSNMIITDEENKILYCDNKEIFDNYCKENNLNYKYTEFNENYINSGSNWYIKTDKTKLENEGIIDLVYNLYADSYPKSKKLNINIDQINISEKETSEREETVVKGNWKMQIGVSEQFYKREAVVYKVKNCSDPTLNITKAVVYNTCMKFELKTEEEPVYNEEDSEEVKQNKINEYSKKIEQVFNSKNSSEYEKTIMIFKNEYVENDKKEKFYPTKSSSEDAGWSRPYSGNIEYWQTFNLTKYDYTDKLNVYIQYKGKDVVIELERK